MSFTESEQMFDGQCEDCGKTTERGSILPGCLQLICDNCWDAENSWSESSDTMSTHSMYYPPPPWSQAGSINQTREGPSVDMSDMENKIKDLKTEIMKEMQTEFDEKIKEMQTEMDRTKKNEKMNSSALSVLFKKEKERETQWAEREKKMDQTIDCFSLKLADLETKFNKKGPQQQQEIAKDLMEDYESLKVENERISLKNSELKDELKNLKIKFEETRLSLKTMTDRMKEMAHHRDVNSQIEKQTVARLKETLTIRSRDYEILRTENEKKNEENLELKKKLKKMEDELKGQKRPGSIPLPEKPINSADRFQPGPYMVSVRELVAIEKSLAHKRWLNAEQSRLEISNNEFKKKNDGSRRSWNARRRMRAEV